MLLGLLACAPFGCDRDEDPAPSEVAIDDIQDEFGSAYCERMFACRCEQYRWFESIADCRSSIADDASRLRQVSASADIVYDPACVGERLDALDALGCAAELEPEPYDCADRCPIFHGDRGVGQACTTNYDNSFSECAAALRCEVVACDYDPATDTEVCTGACVDPCAPGESNGCSDCGADSYCDYSIERCQPLPELGGACDISGRCAGDTFCNGGTCVARVALGDACSGHRQCDSGYCPAGTCAELPGRGESCAGTNACASGLACDFETAKCVEADALICQAGAGLEIYD